MDKIDKRLTDRELIETLVAWYKLDQSTEELREAVAAYVRQDSQRHAANSLQTIDESISSRVETRHSIDGGVNRITPASAVTDKSELAQVTYTPQFEPTDELIGTRGWSIDAWALYYGIEEFFHRISFGLLNMQSLAVLFCVVISGAVMFGAWQSMLSSERQKKAAFKSINTEQPEKGRIDFSVADQRSQSEDTGGIPISEPIAEPIAAPDAIVASPSIEPVAIETNDIELNSALRFMEDSDWKNALAKLQTMEQSGTDNFQPLLTLLQVEALIQKRDTESMELARQLLMDCKWGEHDTVYDLLVARWMLLSSAEDRKRFLSEVASLPESARRRMSTWAQIRNGARDAMTEVMLETTTAKGPSEVCDLLFLASYHFNVGKIDDTIRELLDTQQKLRALQANEKSEVETWLLGSAKRHLASKIDDILGMVSRQPRKPIN